MNERSLAQQANALITKYVKLYTEKHGQAPIVNRYRDKWGFQNMVEDLGKPDAEKVIEFYFSLRRPHEMIDLFRSYDELHKQRLADEKDQKNRAQLRRETAKRVKEFLQNNGAGGTSGSGSSLPER